MSEHTQTVSVSEAARLLGIRLDQIYRLVRGGTISGTKQDGIWKIARRSVDSYSRRRRRNKSTTSAKRPSNAVAMAQAQS
jgi:excisionase family DNA binding protein